MGQGLSEAQRRFFHRNLLIEEIGEEGQEKLLKSRVLVIGLGGLGSPALLYLTAAGVGEIGIVDRDRVEESNLQRQILYGERDCGSLKTTCARERAAQIRKDVRVVPRDERLCEANAVGIISDYDFVIEATDDLKSKFLVNDVCVALNKPFSHAGVTGLRGQAMTVMPGRSPCVRCVFGDLPHAGGLEAPGEQGVLGPVAGVMGAVQAVEAIKYLAGFGELLTGRLLTWDAGGMVFREVRLPAEPSCEVCQSLEIQTRDRFQGISTNA
jgi:molybdopterin/thiamine biosynthesis adenylyltransferase